MNKKARAIYWWAAFFSIIVGIFVVYDHRGQISNWIDEFLGSDNTLPKFTSPQLVSQPPQQNLNCDNINIKYIRPIRSFFYAGGTAAVTYAYDSNIGCNVTITQEWYRNPKPDIKFYLQQPYNWNDTVKQNTQNNWASFNVNDKEGNTNYTAKIILGTNKSEVANYTSFEIIREEGVIPYLGFDEIINTDKEVIDYAFKSVQYNKNVDEYSQAKQLFYFTRSELKKPNKADEIIDFENKNYSSLQVYQMKKGTSSEFAVFYIMLLRSIGIPAKINSLDTDNGPYYYTEVFTKDTGWLLADIFSDSEFDSCFVNNATFLPGHTYQHQCLENNSLEFVELSIPKSLSFKSNIYAKIRNKMDKNVRYLTINYTLYKDGETVLSNYRYADNTNLIKNEITSYNSFDTGFDNIDFNYVTLKPDYWS